MAPSRRIHPKLILALASYLQVTQHNAQISSLQLQKDKRPAFEVIDPSVQGVRLRGTIH